MVTGFVYKHFSAGAYFNMACDEWMFIRSLQQPGSVFLRLYTWREGAITFGYNQCVESAIDLEKAGTVPVIRRVTGGRAVFHDTAELTYSLVVNQTGLECSKLCGSVSRTSHEIAVAVSQFLASRGLRAVIARPGSPLRRRPTDFHSAPCFESTARSEISVSGRKVAAAAQRRIGPALLQHGSLKLSGNPPHPALRGAAETALPSMNPVSRPEFDSASHDFMGSFSDWLGLDLAPALLSRADLTQVHRRELEIQKNPLDPRQIIKQNTSETSP
ncbi:MAG: lipoate--protein ligase family protein [Candidatus Zixiibacteriota bacterium]|nr:MAG: lipoate--protein ligase family protein [candidate division Zixibacteria bacterium]